MNDLTFGAALLACFASLATAAVIEAWSPGYHAASALAGELEFGRRPPARRCRCCYRLVDRGGSSVK